MHNFLVGIGIWLAFLLVASLFRAITGPTILDRMVGLNAIGSKTVVFLVLIGFLYRRPAMFLDIALAYAILNFISVLAVARYFQKRKGLFNESRYLETPTEREPDA